MNSTQLNKENIADWCSRLSAISKSISDQFINKDVQLYEGFFIDLLQRQSVLLNDISHILRVNVTKNLSSVRILLRCLLEDFITVLYLHSNDFDKELIIKQTADGLRKNLDIQKTLCALNAKFFEGKSKSLATTTEIQSELDSLFANSAHHIFFINGQKGKFKTFPGTTELIKNEIQVNSTTKANAHSLAVWKLFSKYVHYSRMTYYRESTMDEQVELRRLKEVIIYLYKCMTLCCIALENYQMDFISEDPTNLKAELFDGTIGIEDIKLS